MAARSNVPVQLDVLTVEDIKVENGILEIPLNVQFHGTDLPDGQIRIRLDLENAKNLQGRLPGGIVTASNQLRRRT